MRKKSGEIKVNKPDFAILPLKEYYKGLPAATRKIVASPKDEFLDDIAALTGRTRETARTWCLGQVTPPPHVREKLAKHFRTSPETLFPDAV